MSNLQGVFSVHRDKIKSDWTQDVPNKPLYYASTITFSTIINIYLTTDLFYFISLLIHGHPI